MFVENAHCGHWFSLKKIFSRVNEMWINFLRIFFFLWVIFSSFFMLCVGVCGCMFRFVCVWCSHSFSSRCACSIQPQINFFVFIFVSFCDLLSAGYVWSHPWLTMVEIGFVDCCRCRCCRRRCCRCCCCILLSSFTTERSVHWSVWWPIRTPMDTVTCAGTRHA